MSFMRKEGDNLEVFIQEEQIILQKHSMMNKITDLAQELTDAVYTFMKYNIFITDTDMIIASSGNLKKEYINKQLSEDIIESIKRRENRSTY